MALQFDTTLRNNMLDQIESTTGVSAILKIRTGAPPANCAAADAGTVLATLNLPSDWMNAASGGSKTLLGTWEDTSADAAGTADHFRIYNSGDTVCYVQGTVGTGAEDLVVDNDVFAAGQQFTITTFTLTAPGA